MPKYSMTKAYKYIGLWVEVNVPKHMEVQWLVTDPQSPNGQSRRARDLWIASNTHSRVATQNDCRYFFEDPREAVHFKLVVDTL